MFGILKPKQVQHGGHGAHSGMRQHGRGYYREIIEVTAPRQVQLVPNVLQQSGTPVKVYHGSGGTKWKDAPLKTLQGMICGMLKGYD